jgi:hypothetical protein
MVNFIFEKGVNLPCIAAGANPLSITGNRMMKVKANKFLYLVVLLRQLEVRIL